MKVTTGPAGSRIVAFGHYQPARVVTNDELSQRVDTNDQWIRERVGIVSRRIAAEDETVTSMSVAAAQKAIASAGIDLQDIDTIIVASCSDPTQLPNLSTRVAAGLGIAGDVATIDLNTACSGFSYALAVADQGIRTGASRTTVVIGAEKLTNIVDQDDRSTCIIFADGAGAVVVTGTDDPGIGPVVWGSEPSTIIGQTDAGNIYQEGQKVFRWATTALAPVARKACEAAGIEPSELAAFVPHQANLRIIESIAKKLNAPNAIVATDIVESGNTSSASIPLALSKMSERGELPSGGYALLLGFGGGVTYAGQVVTLP